jgi:hypothetical protein
MSGPLVDTTVINGRVVMQGRKLAGIDEAEVLAKSRELAEKVWQRFTGIGSDRHKVWCTWSKQEGWARNQVGDGLTTNN